MPKTQLDYFAFDLRPAGALGALAWLAMLGVSVAFIGWRSRLRALVRDPVVIFGAGMALFYSLIFCVYGDDLFLFSPDLVLPLLLLVVTVYAMSLAGSRPAIKTLQRTALAVAALSVLVNSSLHVRDMLAHYV
jgi:hypothetical protein